MNSDSNLPHHVIILICTVLSSICMNMQSDFFATIPAAPQYDLTYIINLLLRASVVRK